MQASMKAAPAGRASAGRRVRRRTLAAAAARARMHIGGLMRAELAGRPAARGRRAAPRARVCRCIGPVQQRPMGAGAGAPGFRRAGAMACASGPAHTRD
jgi:hypothetical protein